MMTTIFKHTLSGLREPMISDEGKPNRVDWLKLLVRLVTLIIVVILFAPRIMPIYHFAADNPQLFLIIGLVLFVGGLLGQNSNS